MPFYFTDLQQKIRISLSQRAYEIITEDMQIFGFSQYSGFINEVIENFRDKATASLDIYHERRIMELTELFAEIKATPAEKNAMIKALVEKEEKSMKEQLHAYLKEKHISKVYYLNNDNLAYLTEDCNCDRYYDGSLGRYLKCMLEEYADLPFIKRTRIVRRKTYELIQNAITNRKPLKIKVPMANNTYKVFRAYPYKIMSDQMKTRDYLICYTQDYSEQASPKRAASFSMVRLEENCVSKLGGSANLNKNEILQLEQEVSLKTVSYVLGDIEEHVRVRLTPSGKRLYQSKLFSRPEKSDESTEDEYVFHCTEKQAYDYFFSFGKEAQIIVPVRLREKMVRGYNQALNCYKKRVCEIISVKTE